MPDERPPSLSRDRKFREGFARLSSPALERRLAQARREFNARHPERERVIVRANRNRPHPFLVLAAAGGDQGERPIPPSSGLHNASLEVFELTGGGKPTGNPVGAVKVGKSYQIRCRVVNLGSAPVLVGIAEFFVATPAQLDAAAVQPETPLPALGYGGFSLPRGKTAVVICRNPWSPTQEQSVKASVLAQVYDPTGDFVVRRFDALQDRHVGRLDLGGAPEFEGTWRGAYFGPIGKEPEIEVMLLQTGTGVTADIAFSNGVKVKASGQVKGQQAILESGPLAGFPQSTGTWSFSLLTPSALRLKHEIVPKAGAKLSGNADLGRIK